jgi:hypothetical protein
MIIQVYQEANSSEGKEYIKADPPLFFLLPE